MNKETINIKIPNIRIYMIISAFFSEISFMGKTVISKKILSGLIN